MSDTLIGLIVGLILGILGVLFGRKMGKQHTVISDKDILDGVLERRKKADGLRKSAAQILHESKEETKKISQELKEAPNEEIVRRFHDAFTERPSDLRVRSRSTTRRLSVQRHSSDE